jgi:hypothetical protein
LLLSGAAALCLAALLAHAWSSLPYLPDDSFISLRYAKRLADGRGLTWNDGERVEGYSNFLWVLLMAALGKLRIDYVTAARAAGAVSLGSIVIGFFLGSRPRRVVEIAAPVAGALALALAAPVGVYALAGLEHPLSTALLFWALFFLDRLRDEPDPPFARLALPGVLLGLCSLARADAALLVAGAVFGLVAARGASRAALLAGARLTAVAAGIFGAALAFRRLYHGDWVPNTFHAKVALTATRLFHGLTYLREASLHLVPLGLFVAAALVAAVFDRSLRARLLPALVPLFLWCAYVVFIGGDNMGYGRHLVPAVVLAAIVTAHLVGWALARGPRATWAALLATPALLAYLGHTAYHGPLHPMNHRHWNWSGEPIGLFLRRAFAAQRPLLAVDAAGSLPFYAELPTLDMLGLNDRYIATHKPANFGLGHIAHELGDARYTLSRKPDIVAFATPFGGPQAKFPSGFDLLRDPEFARAYRLIGFESERPKVRWEHYLRIEDGPLGVERSEGRISVPGFLLAGAQGAAVLTRSGRLAAHLTEDLGGSLELEIPAGRWTAHLETDGPVLLTLSAGGAILGEGAADVTFESPGSRVVVATRLGAGSTHLFALTLERR